MINNFHQNIIYDRNISRRGGVDIRVINNEDDIYDIGTLCKIQLDKQKIEDEEQSMIIMKGIERVKRVKTQIGERKEQKYEIMQLNELDQLVNKVQIEEYKTMTQGVMLDPEYMRQYGMLIKQFSDYKQQRSVNIPELIFNPQDYKNIDIICGYLVVSQYLEKVQKQELLEIQDIKQRIKTVLQYFSSYSKQSTEQLSKYRIDDKLVSVNEQRKQMDEIYRYLNKNQIDNQSSLQFQKIEDQIRNRQLPNLVYELLRDKMEELLEIDENHQEYQNKRQLIQMILEMPYGQSSQDNFDIEKASHILENEHFGMNDVKQRILEFIAVSKLRGSYRGKVILLVGPPGVGKTSIGQSVANCLGRKYGRISLGGETDTAILKGHRKTYMGAYPGKIVQLLKQLKTENPVILLDEIDKVGQGVRGNIKDTLLEVLDPEQNHKFIDNYLEVQVDLSKVLFLCSANLIDTISQPLLDRMEVIQLRGYTFQEKLEIAEQYLLPKAIDESGLSQSIYKDDFTISRQMIELMINQYSRESGVRSLQRNLNKICEKMVYSFMMQYHKHIQLDQSILTKYLGLPMFRDKSIYKNDSLPVGVIIGLAYNSYGGTIMYIETMNITQKRKKDSQQGKEDSQQTGNIQLTGSLGDVMAESVQIAYTFSKNLLKSKLDNDFLMKNSLHIHFPEGSTPKDGPSAGLAITSAFISQAIQQPIQISVAMTGEISLTGKALAIGGVREKILAAKREGIKTIIIPYENTKEVEELESNIKQGVEFHYVDHYDEVLSILWPSLN